MMKAAALLLFSPQKPAKLFCVQIIVLEAEWHIARFAGASISIFFLTLKAALHTDTVIVMLSHVLVCQRTRWHLSQIPYPHTCTTSPTWCDTMTG